MTLSLVGKEHSSTARSYFILSYVLHSRGDWEAAESAARASIQIHDGLGKSDPIDSSAPRLVLGWSLSDMGRLEEAREWLGEAREVRERLLGPDHVLTLTAVSLLGQLATRRQEFEEAAKLLDSALTGFQVTLGEKHRMVYLTRGFLGELEDARAVSPR